MTFSRSVSSRRSPRLSLSGPPGKRRKTRKGQVPEAALDALHSQLVRKRDKWCMPARIYEWKDCWGPLDAAHYISRSYRGTRWDEENAAAICKRHHALFHANPVLAGRFWIAVRGREKCDSLWIKAQAAAKVDRAAVKAYLQEKLQQYE